MDKHNIDRMGKLLAELVDEFNLPLYDVVRITEKHFYGRPWKGIILRMRGDANGQRKDSTEGSETG